MKSQNLSEAYKLLTSREVFRKEKQVSDIPFEERNNNNLSKLKKRNEVQIQQIEKRD
ncbi:hypothetical protein ACEW7V_00945 [Areca yellow leaf disease phytoplasma]|uniref:hypothetical protein n=1 Tax=Areca yellow leaf disease phytoplasma TaxID=927614 RepID=UPI0035B55C66